MIERERKMLNTFPRGIICQSSQDSQTPTGLGKCIFTYVVFMPDAEQSIKALNGRTLGCTYTR